MEASISTVAWFECKKLSSTFQELINGTLTNMIIPRKGRFGYVELGPGVFKIFINFINNGNSVTLKYKV